MIQSMEEYEAKMKANILKAACSQKRPAMETFNSVRYPRHR